MEAGCLRVEQQLPEATPAALFAQQHVPDCLALFEQRHHGVAAESSDFPSKLQSPTGMPMLDTVNEISTSSRTQCEPTPLLRSHSRVCFIANGNRRRRNIGQPSRTKSGFKTRKVTRSVSEGVAVLSVRSPSLTLRVTFETVFHSERSTRRDRIQPRSSIKQPRQVSRTREGLAVAITSRPDIPRLVATPTACVRSTVGAQSLPRRWTGLA